jgi:hypothetical protein
LKSLQQFDPRLTLLDDRPLIIACQQLGWHGLITNNYKVLYEPHEVAAIVVATPSIVVAAEGLGHDPLRAAGALLLGLPGLVQRLVATGPTAMSFESQLPRWPSQGPAGSPPTRPPRGPPSCSMSMTSPWVTGSAPGASRSTRVRHDIGDTSAWGGGWFGAVAEAQQCLWVASGGATFNEEIPEGRHLQRRCQQPARHSVHGGGEEDPLQRESRPHPR